MNLLLALAFLFFIGSVLGWVLELFYRRFFSKMNRDRKWLNPGFCTGPYLPIYGSGLCILYLIAALEDIAPFSAPVANRLLLFAAMTVCMTLIEYIAGIALLKFGNVRLWDYSEEWGNIDGIICPKFSFFWGILGALYYFLVHPHILDALSWLSRNLAFSFFIGVFFGVFALDVANSFRLVSRLKTFAKENDVIVKVENIKAHIRRFHTENSKKYHFFRPFHSELPLIEHLQDLKETFEKRIRK